MAKHRIKRTEPQHKLREYLETKKHFKYDLSESTGIKKPDLTKLKNFDTILSAERFSIITNFYLDNFENTIDTIFPDLQLPIKESKDFKNERSELENSIFQYHPDYMSIEEISYLTDIDIDRLKEIISKPTVIISASELILLEKVKKFKKGFLFKIKFKNGKIKRVIKKKAD
ncbi:MULTISPECIES: hypothetical protein [Sphingobacterium]|uniref:hypothetical protein n=1 Tax=Sphingobacterium TaxID=28453 RepID=UPI00104EAA1C|nr:MULTISPECIES: hypothetical protein [Sphingobacterium]MCW2263128.1 hypothetical protein [Sphingobacterium kitahiroshimense]TCR11889.1 hypothetical protein EDF67_103302 [Sphingobacterium sp. JUb78]